MTAPTPPDRVADEPELVFQWERRTRAHWRLAGIVGLSLLAHAVSFYVLQVSYTPTGSQLPPPAQVVMISPDGPGGGSFSRWLAMADPALVVQPTLPPPGDTLAALNFRYVPSYQAARPGYKSLDPQPDESAVAAPPRPRPPGPAPLNPPAAASNPAPLPKNQTTHVLLTGGLEALLAEPLPPIALAGSPTGKGPPEVGRRALEPTSFLVGVRPEGGPPFLFPKSKPDNASTEEFARGYLARLRFRPADLPTAQIRWGYAEFAWGNDIYR